MTRGPRWDPQAYLAFDAERGRPFVDLLTRVGAEVPSSVVDLGCGPGTLTRMLRDRWPDAALVAVDSSAEMTARARTELGDLAGSTGSVEVVTADLREWTPSGPVDVLVSNATLQWVPGHLDLLPRLASWLAPGGWLALQVPGNHDAPSHRLRRDLAAREPYAGALRGLEPAEPRAHDPAAYLRVLADAGLTVDAWETTYLHVLRGPDPVLVWIRGTGARPMLQALPDDLRARFEAELAALLREAYPAGPHGTLLPFRRVFAVGHRAGWAP